MAVAVGHDPDAVPLVWGADMTSTHHERPAGVARLLQVIEDSVCASSSESRYVLSKDPTWSELADDVDELAPEAGALAVEARALPRARDVLAGEAAGDEIDMGQVGGHTDVEVLEGSGEVYGADVVAELIDLHLPADVEAGALKAEGHASDSGEQIARSQGSASTTPVPLQAGQSLGLRMEWCWVRPGQLVVSRPQGAPHV